MPPRKDARRARGRSARQGQDRRGQDRQESAFRRLPYTRRNAWFFAAGLGVILIGYFCLAQPPVDGALSLTVAPILLVLGYCVLIPIALLLGGPDKKEKTEDTSDENMGG